MREALRSLLLGVIDYAGLFPPAKLNMADAVAEYCRHWSNDDENWIVDKFVCPASRLDELADELAKIPEEFEFDVSAIGTAGEDFAASVKSDRERIVAFDQRFRGRFCVEAYEIKAPSDITEAFGPLRTLGNIDIYLELPFGNSLVEMLHTIARQDGLAAKVRTGGLEASAFPSSAALASFLHEAYALEIDFKLTAGLHHPIRGEDPATRGMMHGFLNVLVGAALTFHHDLSAKELSRILDERDPGAFGFSDSSVGWRDLSADMDSIDEMRGAFTSFGSCSVKDPLMDLARLGLLDGATI